MKSFIRLIQPPLFQGSLHKKRYFEGWYFKNINVNEDAKLIFIPGVALNTDNDTSHAFIQILDGNTAEYFYLEFPLKKFNFDPHTFRISIGDNTFSANHLKVNIKDKDITVKGILRYYNHTVLPISRISPGVMGIFSFFPGMECNHGIVSMNHDIEGSLNYRGKIMDFKGGKGYIEKDWGKSFPKKWVWMQANHFQEPKRSIMFSIAQIPYVGMTFSGFLLVIYDRGRFYKFTTYNRAKYQILALNSTEFSIAVRSSKYLVLIQSKKGVSPHKMTAMMRAPTLGLMNAKCAETLDAKVKVSLFEFSRSNPSKIYENTAFRKYRLIFSDYSENAGLEIMGQISDFD